MNALTEAATDRAIRHDRPTRNTIKNAIVFAVLLTLSTAAILGWAP